MIAVTELIGAAPNFERTPKQILHAGDIFGEEGMKLATELRTHPLSLSPTDSRELICHRPKAKAEFPARSLQAHRRQAERKRRPLDQPVQKD